MPRKVCHVCKKESPLISGFLGVCLGCLRFKSHEALLYVKKAHEESRGVFNLPNSVRGDAEGKTCSLCALSCQIPLYPHFYMRDLPLTSKDFAHRALEIAKSAGLKRVSLGNVHLLR